MTSHHRIVIELGKQKMVFASAIDWPGWSRSGTSESEAIDRLVSYADRYQRVAELAGVRGVMATAEHPDVVETIQGSGATDSGVPDKIAAADREFMSDAECERQIKLLEACWTYFDEVAANASPHMRKGPRGGGRDRDEIIDHTLEADRAYARRIGVKSSAGNDQHALAQHRGDVVAAVREHNSSQTETKWPLRYYIRRAGWHLLDHAWEMEDEDLSRDRNSD